MTDWTAQSIRHTRVLQAELEATLQRLKFYSAPRKPVSGEQAPPMGYRHSAERTAATEKLQEAITQLEMDLESINEAITGDLKTTR